MQYAIELYYDKETENKLFAPAKSIADRKISTKFLEWSDTKTIFVSPVMNSRMYQFHRELHEQFRDFDTNGWEWYCPDRWVPHCTIALTREDEKEAFFQASDIILRTFEKMSGQFTSLGLVKIIFPVKEIYSVELSDDTAGRNE